MHALVPGGGPSLTADRWIATRHPKQRRKRKPYLVNNQLLSERFRELFIAGVQRLRKRGELQVEDALALDAQLATLRDSPWVVYVEAPPHDDASPENVLKYLARYMTGGPIADRRLLSHEEGRVTFLARSDEKPTDGSRPRQVPVTVSGVEFVRRWSLHILPKGYTKVRRYGGFSNRHAESYSSRCRELLGLSVPADDTSAADIAADASPQEVDPLHSSTHCPVCRGAMICVDERLRPRWFEVMDSTARPRWYAPIQPRAG